MSKEQIEVMRKEVASIHRIFIEDEDCESLDEYIADKLFEKGYRKQSEVIDEFADRLKEAPIKCGLPLLGLSTKEEIEEYFNDIMLQFRDAIDEIAKEMKGGAE